MVLQELVVLQVVRVAQGLVVLVVLQVVQVAQGLAVLQEVQEQVEHRELVVIVHRVSPTL